MELGVRNLAESWVDSYEQKIDCENLVCAIHGYSDSTKNWMISPSRIVGLGIWIIIWFGKGCIHVVW